MNLQLETKATVIPTYVIERLLYEYIDNFIYVECNTVQFNKTTSELTGALVFQDSPYLKQTDKILDSAEAFIAHNQIFYIMAIGHLAYRDNLDICDKNFVNHIEHYCKILGNFVIREETTVYNKPILLNEQDLVFRSTLEKFRCTSKGNFFILSTIMGQESFISKMKVFQLSFDLHAGEMI